MTDEPKDDTKANASPPDHRWDDTSHTRPVRVVPLETDSREVVPCLIVISGRQMGQVFPVTTREARVGRADDADLCIRDASISRFHAAVYVDSESRCRVRDLGSTNGTFVNGRRVADTELAAGDRVQLGKQTILKLEYHGRFENEFHAQLYEAGTRDPLTGTFNRRYLDQHLEGDFRLARRHREDLSLLVVDIDRFKAINDTHGHLAGDSVLRALARILGQRVRGEDILARYGGDEYVLILRRTSPEGAATLAEAVRVLVQDAVFTFKKLPIEVTVSIGVATLTHPPAYANALELLAAADGALYEAKSRGRNRVAAPGTVA